MISLALLAIAFALYSGVDTAKAKAWLESASSRLDARKWLAISLLLIALAFLPGWSRDEQPTPAPDNGPLSLRGDFTGPSASEDAAIIGSLLSELADEIEWDGSQSEPYLRTGVQIDQLRKAARTLRCRGESVGDRQPKARDKIAAYLEQHVGVEGGPLTPETRAAWVSAFRDVGRSSIDAAQ
jgi:hypothetical protein